MTESALVEERPRICNNKTALNIFHQTMLRVQYIHGVEGQNFLAGYFKEFYVHPSKL